MTTLVVVGDAVDVDGYGSTHDQDLVVPSGMMMNHLSNQSWKTKKAVLVLLSILGLTTVVASSASMFFPSIVNSSEQVRTEESFLLQDGGGYPKPTDCVVASGSWPAGDQELNIDGSGTQPFVSCFSTWNKWGGPNLQCWSRSHYVKMDDGCIVPDDDKGCWNNEACVPDGFYRYYPSRWLWGMEYANPNGWNVEGETASCGVPCGVFDHTYD